MNLTVELIHASIRIKYNGILHFYCKRSDLKAIQSWMWNEKSAEKHARFMIEYTLESSDTVICEYDTEDHWKLILTELDKML